jgi:DNA-binding MarR family transcriptional regulator
MSALNVLGCMGHMRVGRLAQIEGVSKPTATRLAGNLERMGLLDRTPDGSDARSWQVGLNLKGERLLVEASRSADDYLADKLANLPTDEQQRLRDALPALVHLLDIKP